jgi:TPR repeat protein
MYANGRGVKQDYGQARLWYQKAASQGYADAKKALDKLNNGQTATPSKGNTTASKSNALAQAGIPPIPSRDDAWVSISDFSNNEEGFSVVAGVFYVAPSTIVKTRKPNGFMIWMRTKTYSILTLDGAPSYTYKQYDCDREVVRDLTGYSIDSEIEIKTGLWADANKEFDRKVILNYCN